MEQPAFAEEPNKESMLRRYLIGLACTVISLLVLFFVCHVLETMKEQIRADIKRGAHTFSSTSLTPPARRTR